MDTVRPRDCPDAQNLVNAGRLVRVTHEDDPVTLIPLVDWGFRHHGVYLPS
jgi:hypothetical protein